MTDPERTWPVEEATPLFFAVIKPKENATVPENPTPDSGDVDPQEPGTITGYRKHSQEQVDAVNEVKAYENELGDLLAKLAEDLGDQIDGRWISIARTHLQQGFMALNRSIFQPDSRL